MAPSLNAKGPSWSIRTLRKLNPFGSRIEPETYSQSQKIEFNRFGLARTVTTKSGAKVFGEIEGGNQFAIDRPSGGTVIDPSKALANNRGFVYAAMNAIAREVMTIDWRLFESGKKNDKEKTEHEVLNLLDAVNDSMISLVFKYLLSACLTLTGNCYIYMEGVNNDTDEPKALHLMPPDKVRPVIDRRSWPYQLVGYKMKLETIEMAFKPYEVIQLQLPNPSNFFEGMSPVQAGAEYIDNDNYAQEFNRKFFKNGARPAGFLETNFVAETQIDVLKVGFANLHQGIDNMNGIGVLPKDVKWVPNGSSPKDMDFKNLSEDAKERILMMFGTSKTILGTAESDTNRATAETADYVFSKRVVKPHMLLICAFLNEKLLPRYGDNIYLSFIDPVPEDRAARTTEMQASTGSQPVLTVNEAREQFMGLGPIEGGDVLMKPGTMGPVDAPAPEAKPPVKDPNEDDEEESNDKSKFMQKVAYRPIRSKFLKRAQKREVMRLDLAATIKKAIEEAEKNPSKRFDSTKENDEVAWKKFSTHTQSAEKEIADVVRRLNGEQKKQVIDNLPKAIEKGIDPTKLFDVDKWISIMADALTPTLETLFVSEGKTAAAELGKPDLNPLSNATAAKALHDSISLMAKSYNQTTLATLEAKINDGLSQGQSLTQISKTVEDIYEWSDTYRANQVAKTESFRTANMGLKEAWKQSEVVKTIRWYTSEKSNVCPYCQAMDGKVISIDNNFFDVGQTLTVGDGDDATTMTFNYSDVGAPPLHVNCSCFARPEDVSI
jgi:HK97 family phage portal protein